MRSISGQEPGTFASFLANLEPNFERSINGTLRLLKEIATLGIFEKLESTLKANLSTLVNKILQGYSEIGVFEHLLGFLAALVEFNDEEGLVEFTTFGENLRLRILSTL